MVIDINNIQERLASLNRKVDKEIQSLFNDYPDIKDFDIEIKKQYDANGNAIFNGLAMRVTIYRGTLLIHDKPKQRKFNPRNEQTTD